MSYSSTLLSAIFACSTASYSWIWSRALFEMSSFVADANARSTTFSRFIVTSSPPRWELPLLLITLYVLLRMLRIETSMEPPPKSKTRTVSSLIVLIRPYEIAAAVGSLMRWTVSIPAIFPA